ncbi:C-type lectin domain family 2 member B-like [Strix uralensis]|uniref:C-type lectin domain family 2 member B-like n=1 Tax=Strix uralensis TaxID=36305 RepID=UPI003DA6E88C
MAEAVPEAGFSLKCIKDKKVPVGVTVAVAALLLTIIALAAKKCLSCPSCPSPALPSCPENALGYRLKCFYFVEDEADWNMSQSFCLSLGAHLTTIDSLEELDFLLRYGRSIPYWVGLRREGSAPWKWFDGAFLNSSFPVQGDGQCAYINHDGVSSDWCSQKKCSVCSHPQKRRDRVQESKILLNFT